MLKIRLSAYKSKYNMNAYIFMFAIWLSFHVFSFCWCQKGGEINELIRERDKKERSVDIDRSEFDS